MAGAGEPGGGPEFRAAVGEILRKARCLMDENLTRFAASFGVINTTWRKWELGETIPDARVMAAFCDRTGFTMDWLYRGRLDTLSEDWRLVLYRAHPELLDQGMRRLTGNTGKPMEAAPQAEAAAEMEGASLAAAVAAPGAAKGRRPKRKRRDP